MAFEKGKSGNPGGDWAEKPIRDALRRACVQEDFKRVREGIEVVLDECAKGNQWAVQFVTDKLDGKSTQPVSVDGTVTHEHVGVSETLRLIGEAIARAHPSTLAESVH